MVSLATSYSYCMKEKILKYTEQLNGCWLWTRSLNSQGYGKICVGNSETKLVHRVAYEIFKGPIGNGMELDHLCRNPRCCNPDHLEPVSHRENMLRGKTVGAANAIKTHCKNGHELNEANAYRFGVKRLCRICRAAAEQRRRDRIVAKYGVSYIKSTAI